MIFAILLRRYVISTQICDYFAHICNFDLRKNVIDSLRRYVKRGLFCEHFNLVFFNWVPLWTFLDIFARIMLIYLSWVNLINNFYILFFFKVSLITETNVFRVFITLASCEPRYLSYPNAVSPFVRISLMY